MNGSTRCDPTLGTHTCVCNCTVHPLHHDTMSRCIFSGTGILLAGRATQPSQILVSLDKACQLSAGVGR